MTYPEDNDLLQAVREGCDTVPMLRDRFYPDIPVWEAYNKQTLLFHKMNKLRKYGYVRSEPPRDGERANVWVIQ